ncbi:flagellar motor protein MotB [Sphingomonas sp. MMS24-J13]|uniref:OmpA/MotB family protein n=1 Tax=Sphingomonas sp. MMS24-J13 TaxID=3238686 RepID=UPI00384C5509
MDNRGVRRSRSEEEEESYFVSMSDMMVGLLFIFIILLLYFALQFHQTTDTLTSAGQTRREILETLKERLDKRLRPYNLTVRIDAETGVLSLPNSILFDTGQFVLSQQGRQAVGIVSDELAAVLPCYTDKAPGGPECRGKPIAANKIDAIFVEGHTDSDPLTGGGFLHDNMDLSALRATNTFRQLTDTHPELERLVNSSGHQPVPILGVAGYGERRPVPDAAGTPDQIKAQNRRIDLRFLMVTPKSADGAAMSHILDRR